MALLKTEVAGRLARALLALVAMMLAFGPPLDSAAHAAAKAVEAGSTSPVLKLLSAFDVLDDAFDHIRGDRTSEPAQVVVQLALPEPVLVSVIIPRVTPIELRPTGSIPWSSRMPPPLDRPPRT
jgi:hypothetical protein